VSGQRDHILHASGLDPSKGMSRAECEALCEDLASAGIELTNVEVSLLDLWRVTYRSPVTNAEYIVTNAQGFRENVAAGRSEAIPPAVFRRG
jgi:hypothetical protein